MIQPLFRSLLAFALVSQSNSFAQYADRYVATGSPAVIEETSFRLIVSPAGSTLVDVSVEKLPDVPVIIQLRNEDRQTLLFQQSRTDSPILVRRLDLHELDNGIYWLTVRVGKKYVVRKLRLISLSASEQIVVLE